MYFTSKTLSQTGKYGIYYLLVQLQNYRNTLQLQWLAAFPQCHNQTVYPARKSEKRFSGWLEIFCRHNHWPFPCEVSPALLLDVYAGNCQNVFVDKSGMSRHQILKTVAV
jgi:hypothetical protein